MFKTFSPLKNKMFQIMDNNGEIIAPDWKPDISDDIALEGYKRMLYARTADLMAVSYQRQGRMYTYPPNLGQEAISVTAGMVLRNEDWLVPAYRELGAYLGKGATMKDMFLLWGGHEDGSLMPGANHMLPTAVPIASQLLHAAGIGYAINFQKKDEVVFTFVGDGGTSEGDFHEGLNFAGVWKAPVIFIIQNNGYAISHPREKQTATPNLASKAAGYGIPGIQIDGNDFFALYAAYTKAIEHAKAGNGPVLIEAITYRLGAHTTSDDPSKYRSKEEEEKWAKKDPLKRLKLYLINNKKWEESGEEALVDQYKKEIDTQFLEFENYPPVNLEDVFKYQYDEMPDDLKMQQMEYERFLKWKEALV